MQHGWRISVFLVGLMALGLAPPPRIAEAQLKAPGTADSAVRPVEQLLPHEAALAVTGREIEQAERTFGVAHPQVGRLLIASARQNSQLGRYGAAERDLARAVGIFQATSEGAGEAEALIEASRVKERYGDFNGSLDAATVALGLRRAVGRPDDTLLADATDRVGAVHYRLSRFAAAESNFRDALAIRQRVLPPDHPDIVSSRFNIALIDDAQGRLSDARRSVEELLPLQEARVGDDPEAFAKSLSFLATIVTKQNRFAEAEQIHLRALRTYETAFGPSFPGLAQPLINLGVHYTRQERGVDAERALLRALELLEAEERKNEYLIGVALITLSAGYINQRRFDEALPLAERALALQQRQFGEMHQAVIVARTNLGRIHQQQGRLVDAQRELEAALQATEKLGLGRNDRTIVLKIFYANVLMLQKKLGEAERSLREALSISESVYGRDHVRTAEILGGLGHVLTRQSRLTDAEREYASSARIWCDDMPLSIGCADALDSLGTSYFNLKRQADALAAYRRATEVAARRRQDRLLANHAVLRAEHRVARDWYLNYLVMLNSEVLPADVRAGEAFRAVQALRSSQTAQQVARMAVRQATGVGKVAALTRERQDLERDLERIDKDIASALMASERSSSTLAELRGQRAAAEERLAAIDDVIGRSFPAYKTLIDPEPLSVGMTQRLLHLDEALVSVVVGPNATFVSLVTPSATVFRLVWIKQHELAERVARLRRHLDPSAAAAAGDTRFPYGDAHGLYTLLLAPFEPQLHGIRHLLIVLDGPLQTLPPSVLVTDEVQEGAGQDVPWLIRRYAISVLPAESALSALRGGVQRVMDDATTAGFGTQAFAGFGDPLLSGQPGQLRSALRAIGATKGRALSVSETLRQLPRLPETRAELRSISKALGGSDRTLYFGDQASETRIKSSRLDAFRVIAFATHGLLADELPGVQEPALVMTPPAEPSDEDDGLLTASEIAGLNLRADWVVLSACNTAAGDGSTGAEGLSGLSKAFFYAGARSLLVSHWSVDSAASVALTTQTFAAYAAGQSKAQALRTAALKMMDLRRGGRNYDHPMYWAPFVVVGDGATTRDSSPASTRAIKVNRGT